MDTPGERIEAVIAEFAELDPRERLELLLDYAENLPPLPERFHAAKAAGEHRVHECQTPVFLWVELTDGRVQIHGDVAPEAPTVKGFVGILVEAFSGSTPEQVLATPADLLHRLGLAQTLGMTRSRGLAAVLARVRAEVARVRAGASSS